MALISIRRLRKDQVSQLLEAPGTGMGFQKISISNITYSCLTQNLEILMYRNIVNGEYVFDYDNLNIIPLLFNMKGYLKKNIESFEFEPLSLVTSSKYDDTTTLVKLPLYTYIQSVVTYLLGCRRLKMI